MKHVLNGVIQQDAKILNQFKHFNSPFPTSSQRVTIIVRFSIDPNFLLIRLKIKGLWEIASQTRNCYKSRLITSWFQNEDMSHWEVVRSTIPVDGKLTHNGLLIWIQVSEHGVIGGRLGDGDILKDLILKRRGTIIQTGKPKYSGSHLKTKEIVIRIKIKKASLREGFQNFF